MNYVVVGLFILAFLGCEQEGRTTDFYYWRTTFKLSPLEANVLKQKNSKTLYVRLFDVDKVNGKFQPLGIISKLNEQKITTEIVPVVFIMNRVWNQITKDEISFLTENILQEIRKKENHWNVKFTNEIQIDSDWTASTQKEYFSFLENLKKQSGKEISATIRLHQIKDKEIMGIPPISKGTLMCYATNSPLEESHENSILNLNRLQNYLRNLNDYKLPLNYALPIYSWGIITNHLGKKRLVNGLSNAQLDTMKGITKIKQNQYKISEDGFYFGRYLNTGFTIKVEEISDSLLHKTVDFLDKKTHQKVPVIYYQLDEQFLKNRKDLP